MLKQIQHDYRAVIPNSIRDLMGRLFPVVMAAIFAATSCKEDTPRNGSTAPVESQTETAMSQTPAAAETPLSASGVIGCMDDWTAQYDGTPWIPPADDLVLVDKKTGSQWNVLGQAFSGPLAERSQRLKPLSKAFNSFWFAWSVFWPGSEVWGRTEKVREATIRSDSNCEVPCSEIRLGCGSGKDCIPALPASGGIALPWVDAASPEISYLAETDTVVGIFMNGVARAYPQNILWWHEIANDVIPAANGVSKRFGASFCPLTGSAVVYDALQGENKVLTFGVSGNLYNSNLVMFDRETESWWSQMRLQPIAGALRSTQRAAARTCPHIETTWGRWKAIFPQTQVLSNKTGFGRNYTQYPYLDYREDHSDTFRSTNPPPDNLGAGEEGVRNKDMAFGVLLADSSGNLAAKAYVWKDVQAKLGDRAVINDTVAGRPIVIVWDAANRMMLAYERTVDGETAEFEVRSQ